MTKPYMNMIQVNSISVREAAEVLGISFPYVHNLIRDGKLSVVGKFAGSLILDRHQVERLKVERETERRRRPQDGRLK
jgi:excisionase family DNA binding protein